MVRTCLKGKTSPCSSARVAVVNMYLSVDKGVIVH
jgi:hypothetical protein